MLFCGHKPEALGASSNDLTGASAEPYRRQVEPYGFTLDLVMCEAIVVPLHALVDLFGRVSSAAACVFRK